ncbi:MAG: phosphatase PAP2 family protein [Sphingomonas sp.]
MFVTPSSPGFESPVAALHDRHHHAIRSRWILAMLAAAIAAVAALMRSAGLRIDPRAPGTLHFVLAFSILGATRWMRRHARSQPTRIVRDAAEYFGLFTAISLVGAVASYPIAANSHGFVDPLLHRSDLALHFRWLAWYGFVAAHPLLQPISRAAYAMIYVSPAILLGFLAVTDQRREAHDFLVAVAIAAAITLAAFRFMPAVGPFGYLWHGPIPYLPVSDLWQPELIPQLRHHSAPVVDLGHLVGLVSAPSFHAAAGVLLIAFAARQPAIRVPLVAINLAMLLATPVEGTHYLTDMILGAVVALGALGIVTRLHRDAPRGAPAWLSPVSAPGRASA